LGDAGAMDEIGKMVKPKEAAEQPPLFGLDVA
jgi:hypothetical protein